MQRALTEIVSACGQELSPRTVRPVCIERSAEEQHREYQKGRIGGGKIVTTKDGYDRLGPHQRQPAHGEMAVHAIDFGVFEPTGAYVADDVRPYDVLARTATKLGFYSGKGWSGLVDRPHVQCFQHFD